MPHMNGFDLLDIVRREFNIPVVMISSDDKEKVMHDGLDNGACFYFIKPIKLSDIKTIWQFAYHSSKNQITIKGMNQADNPFRNQIGKYSEGSSSVNEDNWRAEESKKKVMKEIVGEDGASTKDETAATKKARVVWTSDLHDQFLDAIARLGVDRAVPKSILEVMNVQGLSRENVASHLQKYRLFIKRVNTNPNDPRNRSVFLNELRNSGVEPGQSPFNLAPLPVQQQRQWIPYQPGVGGYNYVTSNIMPPATSQFYNQKASNNNAVGQIGYGQSFPASNQGYMQQPWLGNTPVLNEQNTNFPVHGIRQTGIRIGENLTDGMGPIQRTSQHQSQVRQGHVGGNLTIGQNSNALNLPGQNNLTTVGNMGVAEMGSYGPWNQVGNSNPINNNYVGPMLGTGTISGDVFNQNYMEEKRKGKRLIGAVEHPSEFNAVGTAYTSQGAGPSSAPENGGQFQTLAFNGVGTAYTTQGAVGTAYSTQGVGLSNASENSGQFQTPAFNGMGTTAYTTQGAGGTAYSTQGVGLSNASENGGQFQTPAFNGMGTTAYTTQGAVGTVYSTQGVGLSNASENGGQFQTPAFNGMGTTAYTTQGAVGTAYSTQGLGFSNASENGGQFQTPAFNGMGTTAYTTQGAVGTAYSTQGGGPSNAFENGDQFQTLAFSGVGTANTTQGAVGAAYTTQGIGPSSASENGGQFQTPAFNGMGTTAYTTQGAVGTAYSTQGGGPSNAFENGDQFQTLAFSGVGTANTTQGAVGAAYTTEGIGPSNASENGDQLQTMAQIPPAAAGQENAGQWDDIEWDELLRDNSFGESFNEDDMAKFLVCQERDKDLMDMDIDLSTFEMVGNEDDPAT